MRQVRYALRCTCGAEFVAEETQDFAVFPPTIERQLFDWKREHQFCKYDTKQLVSNNETKKI